MANTPNDDFVKACKDAGFQNQTDWRGTKAIDAFSEYYHQKWDKWERETDGYDGIKTKAKEWWSENCNKFS